MGIRITDAFIELCRSRKAAGQKLTPYELKILQAAGESTAEPEKQYLTGKEIAEKVARGEELTKGEDLIWRNTRPGPTQESAKAGRNWHKDADQAARIAGGMAKFGIGMLFGLGRAMKRRH